MDLAFEAGAAEELEAVAIWYERERPDYGALFLSEIRKVPASSDSLPTMTAVLDRWVRLDTNSGP